ncbi:hypothetical protein L486_04284 [Kwoniella mangroviensis CBS 10435]|uniref:Uncharacterized protein n=1 Tax=Kwoniella mangroviensis CBS 10435 TaxID=1331196 RepID=A0A1B9IS54_9TREE|nr:uncharacterized protein I203_02622 [Kwoniella mangroviensis CBS 8507]OCF58254.1 hypothetical protein L486_04284 [Kwoniella mangroviensis CBS 10435]OCF67963.1 hypothetical protein I203_02622 [Kwoniella mangroviensis CBS 8507]
MSKNSRSKSTTSTTTILGLTILFLILVSQLTWIGWKIDNSFEISSSCLYNSSINDSRQSATPLSLDKRTGPSIATGLRSVFQHLRAVVNKVKDKIMKNDREQSPSKSDFIVNLNHNENSFTTDQLYLINKYPKPVRNLYISTFHSIHRYPDPQAAPISTISETIKWKTLHQTLNLSLTLQTPEVGRQLLSNLQPVDQYGVKHQFELFNLAAQFDDVYAASRVIASIRGYDSDWANWND